MASGDDRAVRPLGLDGTGLRIGLVKARWNADIVDRLEAGVDRGLLHLGVPASDIVVETVPGSFEIPMGASILARSGAVDAIITLGVVIRGETTHYEIVSEGAAQGVQQVQLSTGDPDRLRPAHGREPRPGPRPLRSSRRPQRRGGSRPRRRRDGTYVDSVAPGLTRSVAAC